MSDSNFSKTVIALIITLPLIYSSPVCAEEMMPVTESAATDPGVPVSLEAAEAAAIEDFAIPVSETHVETHNLFSATSGYRFMSFKGYGGRASEYGDLHSGPEFSFLDNSSGRDHKLLLDGHFASDNDYYANLTYDYMGAYRVQLRTDSLYHNLETLPSSVPAPFSFFSTPSGVNNYSGDSSRDASQYGVRVEQDLAAFRARLGSYPVHLNLQYWRLLKEGNSQLRFADHAFFPAGAVNTLYSVNRRVDSEIHEGRLGLDAHIGPLDIIYDFTVRQYSDNAGTPLDSFTARQDSDPLHTYQRSSGSFEHSENPESRYLSHTVKLHTEQTGGFVAAAAYSIAQRTNRSSLSQVSGVNSLSDTLQTAAGDIVYTPAKEFSLAVRFRHQEIDRDSATVTAAGFTPESISANKGIDTRKDIISAVISYRPLSSLTVKGEFKGEHTSRSNTDSWDPYGKLSSIELPSSSERYKGVLSILGRPYRNLRLKVRYSYTTVNNPEYGTSFDVRHEGQLQALYSIRDRYGVSLNYLVSHDYNDSSAISRLDFTTPDYDPVPIYRERRSNSATASLWSNLLEGRVSLTGTAGLLHTKTDQQLLFTATSSSPAEASNYTGQALLYGVTAAFRPVEKLSTSIAFQQTRSIAEFVPSGTSGVSELSDLKTVENSLSVKSDYQLQKNVSCGIDYRYRKYSDERSSSGNGSVHSVITTLTARW